MMFTFYAMMNPIKALMNISAAFKPFEDKELDLTLQKLTFFACQMAVLLFAGNKCMGMG